MFGRNRSKQLTVNASHSGSRVSKRALPISPTPCPKTCVYAVKGMCDIPRINKANSDSYWHKKNNKDVLAGLSEAKAHK